MSLSSPLKMHMKRLITTLILLILVIFPSGTEATVATSSASRDLNLYLFYKDECEKCEEEKAYIESLAKEDYRINLEYIDVSENEELYTEVQKELGFPKDNYPLMVVGTDYFMGFNGAVEKKIAKATESYLDADGYCDYIYRLQNDQDTKDCLKMNEGVYEEKNSLVKILAISLCIIIVISIIIVIIKKRRKKSSDIKNVSES